MRLTGEEIQRIEPPHCGKAETEYYHFLDGVELGAKAQLKRVVEWGNERCAIHSTTQKYFKRRLCEDCWQALLEETR